MEQLQAGLIFFLLVALIVVYFGLRSSVRTLRRATRSSHTSQGLSRLSWQLLLVACLAATYSEGSWTISSVGLEARGSWLLSSILGVALYVPLAVLEILLYRWAGYGGAHRLLNREILRRSWPRRRFEKFLFLAAVILNPLTEEMVFRGILVHQLGIVIGSVSLAAGFGLALCLVAHLYQGIMAIPFHAAFFLVTILLLYSPLGLAGSIGLHFAADVAPTALFCLAIWRRDRKALQWKPHAEALRT